MIGVKLRIRTKMLYQCCNNDRTVLQITLETENQILEIYKNNLDLRIFFLNTDFNLLNHRDVLNQSIADLSDRKMSDYDVFVQLSVIAKTMMLIEDFAVLSLSFKRNQNFYDLLQTEADLGETVGGFIRDLPDMSYPEILKIMGWTDDNGNMFTKTEQLESIKKYIYDNVANVQNK